MGKKQQKKLPSGHKSILQNNKKLYPYLFLAPSLIGVTIFSFLPLLDVIRRSFTDAMGNEWVGISNYQMLWTNQAFLLALNNTIKFLSISIPILLLLSLGTALTINHTKGSKGGFRTTLLLPLAIPVACSTLFFKLLFHEMGWLNQMLPGLFADKEWLKGGSAFGVIVFCYIWKNTGYDMILWSAGLQGIDSSLYEAAKVDGAGGMDTFRYITMPLLKPTTYTILILSVLNTFKIFREAYLLAGDYPDKNIYMLQHLFNNWFVALDIQKMSAGAVMVGGSVILMVILLQFGKSRRDKSGKVEKN